MMYYFLFPLIGLFALITFFMPWINFFRHSRLFAEIESLNTRIKKLEREQKTQSNPFLNTPPIIPEKPVTPEKEAPQESKPVMRPAALPRHTPIRKEPKQEQEQEKIKPKTPKKAYSFEQNIATKLPVWIGSISLIFASFFLVKYSIEHGWVGPETRIVISSLFASALIFAGHFLSKRPHIANAARISQGLIGAGIVGLYVTLYAALNLYYLILPFTAFSGMAVVTALAVILSLQHGQAIAVFGLIGGLLTPAMIGAEEPNAFILFSYLFLLFSGLFAVLAYKGWWKLALVTYFGLFCWSVSWIDHYFSAADSFVLILFAMALTTVILAVTGRHIAKDTFEQHEEKPVKMLNIATLAGSLTTILMVAGETSLTLFDWSMLGLLSMALMTLTYFQPATYTKALYAKTGISLFVFFMWNASGAYTSEAFPVLCGMIVLYVFGAAYLMKKTNDPRPWARLLCISSLSLYAISFANNLAPAFLIDLPLFWGSIGLVLAGAALYFTTDVIKYYNGDQNIKNYLIALFSFTATAFITLGLSFELSAANLAIAIAIQIAATAWIFKETGLTCLKKIMYVLTLIFIALNAGQIALFTEFILNSIGGYYPLGRHLDKFILDMPFIRLGIPAAMFYVALWFTTQKDKADKKALHALFGTATILLFMMAFYAFRILFHTGHGHIFSYQAGFIERGLLTVVIASLGIGSIELVRKYDISFLEKWGAVLFRMAIFRFVYFDLFFLNPYWNKDQLVGTLPILNGVTFTYGFGILATLWAMKNKTIIRWQKLYGMIGLAALFALTSLNVRQFFHGDVLAQGRIDSIEFYTYSVTWLLTGLALLATGIKINNKMARMTSLGFLLLAIFKVFLFDAAELEGLLRVFSFLGLGVSLIGLSYFYTRFVFKEDENNA